MNEQQKKSQYDLTEQASKRGDEQSTSIARSQESDDVNENRGIGNIPSPEGDDAAENKVATSLDDE